MNLDSKHVSRRYKIRVLGLQSRFLSNQGERASALLLLCTCDEWNLESYIALLEEIRVLEIENVCVEYRSYILLQSSDLFREFEFIMQQICTEGGLWNVSFAI